MKIDIKNYDLQDDNFEKFERVRNTKPSSASVYKNTEKKKTRKRQPKLGYDSFEM